MLSWVVKHKYLALFLCWASLLIACGGGGGGDDNGGNTPSTQRASCTRYYKVVDEYGNQLTTYTEEGFPVPLTIKGVEYSNIKPNELKDRTGEIGDNGGEMVQAIDKGESTRRFNCVGWVFRKLNCHGGSCPPEPYEGYGWNPEVDVVFRDFTRAGLLRKVDWSERREIGDKCFFFDENDYWHTEGPKHVAEVVVAGWWSEDVTVRAPDGASGVFDAKLNAAWFDQYQGTIDCYRWVDDPPRTVPDTVAAANNTDSCSETDDSTEDPADDEGWILDHLEYTAEERWHHGSGGSRIIDENMNVSRTTTTFTPSPINNVWDTGHYRVEGTLIIEELSQQIPTGEHAIVRASATANISTSGLGFSRAADLVLNIAGSNDQSSEPGAENRDISLDRVAVGPHAINARERITFEASAGLNSINDHRLIIRVVAVYVQY